MGGRSTNDGSVSGQLAHLLDEELHWGRQPDAPVAVPQGLLRSAIALVRQAEATS